MRRALELPCGGEGRAREQCQTRGQRQRARIDLSGGQQPWQTEAEGDCAIRPLQGPQAQRAWFLDQQTEDAFAVDVGHEETVAVVERLIRSLEGDRPELAPLGAEAAP